VSEAALVTETPSGIRVVSEAVPAVRSVALGMWIRTGSRDEDIAEAGVSHFLEHLLFKGTPNYSAVEISEVLDGMGAYFNAFTGKEVTNLHARFLDSHLDEAFSLLGEMLLESTFPDIDSERQVVIEEIAMYDDEPASKVHDLFSQAVFGDEPLGRPIIGRAEVISSISVDEIRKYHSARYTAPNIVISAAGNIDHERLVELASSLSPGSGASNEINSVPEPNAGEVVFEGKETEQFHVCFGTPSIKRSDERRFALAVLDSLLGGSSSSRLFREIREERGLAYSVGTYSEQFTDSGVFAIHTGTRSENIEVVCELIGKEVSKLLESGVPDEELERAREHVKGRLVLSEESTAARMNRIGRAVLHDMPILTLDEMIGRVDAVTGKDIDGLAQELFGGRALDAAAIGPDEERFRSSAGDLQEALA
jgi:predicted Zn-dependent peptidase